jgi:hypothetical protein
VQPPSVEGSGESHAGVETTAGCGNLGTQGCGERAHPADVHAVLTIDFSAECPRGDATWYYPSPCCVIIAVFLACAAIAAGRADKRSLYATNDGRGSIILNVNM